MKFAATKRKIYQIRSPPPLSTRRGRQNPVLIILPNRSPYLWSERNRNHHPNSVQDVFSHTVTTTIFKLFFTRHTMVPVKPNTLSGKLSTKDSKWHFNGEKSVWSQCARSNKSTKKHTSFSSSLPLWLVQLQMAWCYPPPSQFADCLPQKLIERSGSYNLKWNRLSRCISFVKTDYRVLISHQLYKLHSTRPPAH